MVSVWNAAMIQHTPKYDEYCRRQMAEHKLSYEEACRIYESLHQEALQLGAISSANIWDGFEVDLRIAKAINGMLS
jgi:hypothetical protein